MKKKANNYVFDLSHILKEDSESENKPAKYCFFDDDYARKNDQWIINRSIRKRLGEDAVLALMVFNYKKRYNPNNCIAEEFFPIAFPNFDFYDFLALANIASNTAKGIIKLKRQNKSTNIFGDLDVLHRRYSVSNSKLRVWFMNCFNQTNSPACLHPYIRHLLGSNDTDLLISMENKDYKKSENEFIRTANSNRKKINDFLIGKFILNKKIFICRFDVVLRGDVITGEWERFSTHQYRRQVDSFFEISGYFEYALDVIFPTAMLTGNMIASSSPVGQIVLVSTDRVSANHRALKEFAGRVRCRESLDFIPARPFPKGLVPSADGVLEFTPSTVEAINWLAEFLTIERRFVAPRQGGTDDPGTAHCIRKWER